LSINALHEFDVTDAISQTLARLDIYPMRANDSRAVQHNIVGAIPMHLCEVLLDWPGEWELVDPIGHGSGLRQVLAHHLHVHQEVRVKSMDIDHAGTEEAIRVRRPLSSAIADKRDPAHSIG
jgi:hypothetical protein